MYVRLAPRGGARGLSRAVRGPLRSALPPLLAALLAGASAAGCRKQPPRADVTIHSTTRPTPPALGPAVLSLRLDDRSGNPVRGASLHVEAQMSHPGMAPAVATAAEREPGVYEAPLQFTMRGHWIVLVTGTVPGGAAVSHRIDFTGVE